MWKNQYFELDVFKSPHEQLTLLEAELDDINQNVDLPPFIHIDRDVTEEIEYSNYNLSSMAKSTPIGRCVRNERYRDGKPR